MNGFHYFLSATDKSSTSMDKNKRYQEKYLKIKYRTVEGALYICSFLILKLRKEGYKIILLKTKKRRFDPEKLRSRSQFFVVETTSL